MVLNIDGTSPLFLPLEMVAAKSSVARARTFWIAYVRILSRWPPGSSTWPPQVGIGPPRPPHHPLAMVYGVPRGPPVDEADLLAFVAALSSLRADEWRGRVDRLRAFVEGIPDYAASPAQRVIIRGNVPSKLKTKFG